MIVGALERWKHSEGYDAGTRPRGVVLTVMGSCPPTHSRELGRKGM